MSGARGSVGRMVAMGIALALALLLLAAREASAAKYSVAQCGWHLGADADWADTTGGAKFRPDAYCATPANADPFDGAHLKSFTRGGGTVSGTRFARWRWNAPSGTGITRVSGTWWHTLHDGFEQRLGVSAWNGPFTPFLTSASTDVSPRDFVAGFSSPMVAFEDRLLCARFESRWCSLEPGSWSGLRAVTITLEDFYAPGAGLGGQLAAAGWHRGDQSVQFSGSDVGSGVRFGETLLDGARVALAEYPCAKAMISGEWRGTRMRPCEPSGAGTATVATTNFSDGPHTLGHCVADFAGNLACAAPVQVLIDNNPPAHPRELSLAGGEEWRRSNDFDLSWVNPDQGRGSAIGGASWRLSGPAGYDTGVRFTPGHDLRALRDLRLPAAGTYSIAIWLRDEAGNEAPSQAITLPLRLDDVPPGVAFALPEGGGWPASIEASVHDAHSGPSRGSLLYRRLGTEQWVELPTGFEPAKDGHGAELSAHVPGDLPPGTYVFRADAADAAGNSASTTRRTDGTEMAVRKLPAPPARREAARPRGKTRLFAHLRWRHRRGSRITVPFGARAWLSGRLLDAEGAGLGARTIRVVTRPSRGALQLRRRLMLRTGPHGGFRLRLPSGTSRRVTVSFPGEEDLEGARRAALRLRVRSAIELRAAPRSLQTGGSVHLSGRVHSRGAPMPRRGKLVAIQYYESATHRWRPILVTRSDHDGRFHAVYRFRYVVGTARIRLRAVALPEERWPYAPGGSRPTTVRVAG
ncbi:MAG TPA: hypothetical protein VGF04_03015 [Solirubrobacterales bacterium]